MNKFSKIYVIAGLSGVGKDTIVNKLPVTLVHKVVPFTSRPIRPNEVEGSEYHFVTKNRFQDMIDEELFLEYRRYNVGTEENSVYWYYGTHIRVLESKYDTVIVTDIDAMCKLRAKYPDKVVGIILTATDSVREERARLRMGDKFDAVEWERRLADDKAKYNMKELFMNTHVILNDNLDNTVCEVINIIKK